MNFVLDRNTIFLSLVLGHLFTAGLIAGYWRRHGQERTIRVFMLAKLAQAGSWFFLVARGGMPDLVSVSLANSLLFVGYALEMAAVLQLRGAFGQPEKRRYAIMTAVNLAGFHAILLLDNRESLRIAFASVGTALLVAGPAVRLVRAGGKSVLPRAMGAFYLLTVLSLLGRAAAALAVGAPMGFFAPGPFQTPSFLALYLITIAGNTGFILLLRERAHRELLRLARHDDLTGALNRRAFLEGVRESLAGCARRNAPLSLLLFDVDRFKTINDSYGHDAGDRVLLTMSARIRAVLGPDDLFARYGGDEFAVLLPGRDEAESSAAAERIRASASGAEPAFTISLGILTVLPDRDTRWEPLYALCDQALYAAKRAGRDRAFRAEQPQLTS
ncbi:diguanylate cyclase (GGDEF) domain-containing protein [Paenibacillus sp. UNC496MF]|uniref:GGDEF domain-containing protein n=1 Tax=Paenibacillus sp. UNC496MF TaxID=1502753 RepID=UPI0008F12996|nr:GGDEF domain-containing protein [Paenibacillus sp. UNC496MF]SFJ12187.1 diguanylate cyclase (GGDEF) domain-containing protein [Paenibacillus sp. UNC496MF]